MKNTKRILTGLITTSLALPLPAFATNGYFLIGYGAKSRAMGGVGVAYSNDALAAAANPAAMADVELDTMRIDVGGEFFIPRRAIHHDSDTLPADEVSGSNLFLIPNMGGIYKFNRKMRVGMAAIGAGLGTRYDQSCSKAGPTGSYFFNFNCNTLTDNGDTVGVMLIQMQMLPSLSYQINRNHTVGASLAIAVQTFRAYGLGAFVDLGFTNKAGSTNFSNNGNDWSYGGGARVGWMGKFFDKRLTLGANYASRVYMSKFDKYRDLFAEQGSFDIPSHYAVGIAYQINDKTNVAFDVQRINFSEIKSVGNLGPLLDVRNRIDFFPCGSIDCGALGNDEGLGFGWDDMTVYKLGMDYKYDSKLTLRAGLNYGEHPIPNDQILFNLLAPGVVEKHVTAGFSYALSPNAEVSMNVMHAFKETLKGPTTFQPAGVDPDKPVVNAAASMYQWSFGASFGYKF